MRAPFQILAIPYRLTDDMSLYAVLHRADHDQWQFIAGGGEDNETPAQAAIREIFEESGISADELFPLTSMCYVRADCFSVKARANWANDTYVIPEYSFAFECNKDITLSSEHKKVIWLTYDEAMKKLEWDSNKTALYELNERLLNQKDI